MAIYLNKFNELLTWVKREATGSIVIGSIMCCVQIDPSKFAMFVDEPVDDKMLRAFLGELKRKCYRIKRGRGGYRPILVIPTYREIFYSKADFITGYLEDESGSSSEDESGAKVVQQQLRSEKKKKKNA